jgi:hypothetical protein
MLIISNTGQTIYVNFDHIIKQGDISILSKNQSVILFKRFTNCNSIKYHLEPHSGPVILKLRFDGETITKHIII